MMKGHFSSDRFASSSQYGGGSGSGHYPSSSHQSSLPVSAADAEDGEIQKAIALSKETARKEEERRKRKEGRVAARRSNEKDDDFEIGLGFEKFATGNAGSGAANDIDDFDFGNMGSGSKKEEEGK